MGLLNTGNFPVIHPNKNGSNGRPVCFGDPRSARLRHPPEPGRNFLMTPRLLPFAAVTVALAAIGCSDAPARPAKLGLFMEIRNPDPIPEVAGRSCPTTTGTQWDIGKATRQNGVVIDVD